MTKTQLYNLLPTNLHTSTQLVLQDIGALELFYQICKEVVYEKNIIYGALTNWCKND